MCHKWLYKEPSQLYRKTGCPFELQLPGTECPIQHCITEVKKSSMLASVFRGMCLLHVTQFDNFSM